MFSKAYFRSMYFIFIKRLDSMGVEELTPFSNPFTFTLLRYFKLLIDNPGFTGNYDIFHGLSSRCEAWSISFQPNIISSSLEDDKIKLLMISESNESLCRLLQHFPFHVRFGNQVELIPR